MRIIRVGSRESKLAITQSNLIIGELKKEHPEVHFQLIPMKTTGDMILDRSLDEIGGKGLFIKELDLALEAGEIDLAIHSLKDMPTEIPEHFPIVAYSRREDPRDVLVLPNHTSSLDQNKGVGCSSARRRIQLSRLYDEISIHPIRGNVPSRIEKLDQGEYGALVLAYAGLKRLQLDHRVSRVFSIEEILPAAGQGVLALQGRRADLNDPIFTCINNNDSQDAALAEREFIKTLDGGCSSPTAAYAEISGGELKLYGLFVDEKAGIFKSGSLVADRKMAQSAGYRLAKRLFEEQKDE